MTSQPHHTGLYIHWPFCASKCPYCDFNSHVAQSIDHDDWVECYLKALSYYADLLPGCQLNSIFFGGGTPSLMKPDHVAKIIDHAQQKFQITNDIEITLEANPTSSEKDKFAAFKDAGVNRLSLGVQALNDEDLKFLGREHSAQEAIAAIEMTRSMFERYSFDLIYARPQQNLKAWEAELLHALPLSGGHLSLYQLTIERRTPFYTQHRQGLFDVPDEDLAADFYHLTQDVLEAHGLPAYEVSNHAANDVQQSVHNLNYWNYRDYIGIGPGAHGRLTLGGVKHSTRDHAAPEIWLKNVRQNNHAAHPFEALSPDDQVLEQMMMGLRLTSGITISQTEMDDYLDQDALARIDAEGWIDIDSNHLCLTREGLLRLNAIVPYIMKDKAATRISQIEA